ncbi:MAG: hypothetical protein ACNS64_12025 [Candidatus Halalkalibacterium sp. M3_1C_030]
MYTACSSRSILTDKRTPSDVAHICQAYDWSGVELLVQPHIDDLLYTSLVMQAQSSEYKTSEAARQIIMMNVDLPFGVRSVLDAIVEADC